MGTLRIGVRFLGRMVFILLVAIAASIAPMAALPFVYVPQRWRTKEVAALVVVDRKR